MTVEPVSSAMIHWTPTFSIHVPTEEPIAPSQTHRKWWWRRTPRHSAGRGVGGGTALCDALGSTCRCCGTGGRR